MLGMTLKIDLLDYWHAGSGASAGTRVDLLIARDHEGLPYLPGRTLKGLLRDACQLASDWGWFASSLPEHWQGDVVTCLFGRRGDGMHGSRDVVVPGLMQVSDARLTGAERQWLAQGESADFRAQLVKDVHSTAIASEGAAKGVAMDKSLRGMEVAIPMCLWAEVDLRLPVTPSKVLQQQSDLLIGVNVSDLVQTFLPLVEGIGGQRHRGYGRASVSLVNGSSGHANGETRHAN